jgi:hypothetical protein
LRLPCLQQLHDERGIDHPVPREAKLDERHDAGNRETGDHGLGLIRFGGQLNYAADFRTRAALSNSAGLT